jgi:hypothetical protein
MLRERKSSLKSTRSPQIKDQLETQGLRLMKNGESSSTFNVTRKKKKERKSYPQLSANPPPKVIPAPYGSSNCTSQWHQELFGMMDIATALLGHLCHQQTSYSKCQRTS